MLMMLEVNVMHISYQFKSDNVQCTYLILYGLFFFNVERRNVKRLLKTEAPFYMHVLVALLMSSKCVQSP